MNETKYMPFNINGQPCSITKCDFMASGKQYLTLLYNPDLQPRKGIEFPLIPHFVATYEEAVEYLESKRKELGEIDKQASSLWYMKEGQYE